MVSSTAPPVTVLIPAFNAALFIVNALDSVAAQTHAVDQIVVIDDGSTDDTAARVQEWMASHPSCRLDLIRQLNGGPPNARNAGLRKATSPWVALLDADDTFEPAHVEYLHQTLLLEMGVVAIFSKGRYFNAVGAIGDEAVGDERQERKAISAADRSIAPGVHLLERRLFESLVPGNYIHPSCLCINRDAAERIGNFDESLLVCEDRDFLLRLAKSGPFAFVNSVTSGIRIHEDNISHAKNSLRGHLFAGRVLQKVLDNADELQLNPVELELVEEELGRTVELILYSSSRSGLFTCLRAFDHVRTLSAKASGPSLARHLVRAMLLQVNWLR